MSKLDHYLNNYVWLLDKTRLNKTFILRSIVNNDECEIQIGPYHDLMIKPRFSWSAGEYYTLTENEREYLLLKLS